MRKALTSAFVAVSTLMVASPAFAQTTDTVDPRIEHKPKHFWFFWPNFAFAAGVALVAVGLTAVYLYKIVRPRMRGRS